MINTALHFRLSDETCASLCRLITLLPLLAVCCVTLACGGKEVTTTKTEQEALEIVDVLNAEGFEVVKEKVGEGANIEYSIKVKSDILDSGTVAMATQVLRDNGYPRPAGMGGEAAYQNQGFISTESAQAAQRKKEAETESERLLYTLPNVTSAKVQINFGQSDALSFKPAPATATVVVIHKDPNFGLTNSQLQNMVAKGVSNLQPENVHVVVQYKQPRPLPRTSAEARRRNNLLLAAGVGLTLVLATIGLIFYLQTRRQRAAAAKREAETHEPEVVEAEPEAPAVPPNRWLAEPTPTDAKQSASPPVN